MIEGLGYNPDLAEPVESTRRKGGLFEGFLNSPKRFFSKNDLWEVSGLVTLEGPGRPSLWKDLGEEFGPGRKTGRGGLFRWAGIRLDWKSSSSSIRPRHFGPPLAKILSKIDLAEVLGVGMRAAPHGSMGRKGRLFGGFSNSPKRFFRKTTVWGVSGPITLEKPWRKKSSWGEKAGFSGCFGRVGIENARGGSPGPGCYVTDWSVGARSASRSRRPWSAPIFDDGPGISTFAHDGNLAKTPAFRAFGFSEKRDFIEN